MTIPEIILVCVIFASELFCIIGLVYGFLRDVVGVSFEKKVKGRDVATIYSDKYNDDGLNGEIYNISPKDIGLSEYKITERDINGTVQ